MTNYYPDQQQQAPPSFYPPMQSNNNNTDQVADGELSYHEQYQQQQQPPVQNYPIQPPPPQQPPQDTEIGDTNQGDGNTAGYDETQDESSAIDESYNSSNNNNNNTCSMHCQQHKRFYRTIGIVALVTSVLYFLITPFSFPWFLFVWSSCLTGALIYTIVRVEKVSAMIASMKNPRKKKHFFIHLSVYLPMSLTLLVCNVATGYFPWSAWIVSLWGIAFSLDFMKTFCGECCFSSVKKGLLACHTAVYIGVLIPCFITWCYRIAHMYWTPIVMIVWFVVLLLHLVIVKMRNGNSNTDQWFSRMRDGVEQYTQQQPQQQAPVPPQQPQPQVNMPNTDAQQAYLYNQQVPPPQQQPPQQGQFASFYPTQNGAPANQAHTQNQQSFYPSLQQQNGQ